MLKNDFDPTKPLQVVLYLRMSSDQQNPRSPEQQRENIESMIKRLGRPWVVLRNYEDSGISGRYVRCRPGFQKMLREIRTGIVQPQAILVDTFERFGRNDEMASIRRELQNHHGVYILTADSLFADPTSVPGKAMAAFDQLRSTEDNRIKAHNVLRGKLDAARQKHWPGGAAPFGLKLENIITQRAGRQEVDYAKLIPDPETAWIIKRIFDLAQKKSLGCTRITIMLNDDPEIPESLKPFNAQTVNAWLKSEIYCGILVFNKHSTGVVDDRRVIQKNNPDDHEAHLRFLRRPRFARGVGRSSKASPSPQPACPEGAQGQEECRGQTDCPRHTGASSQVPVEWFGGAAANAIGP